MKIVTENCVYNDLNKILHIDIASVPSSIINNFFKDSMIIIDDSNRYEFIKFELLK